MTFPDALATLPDDFLTQRRSCDAPATLLDVVSLLQVPQGAPATFLDFISPAAVATGRSSNAPRRCSWVLQEPQVRSCNAPGR